MNNGLNGSNSSTTSSATSNTVASNVMVNLSSINKSSISPIITPQNQQHSTMKFEDDGYASSTHSQSTHSQLNHNQTTHLHDSTNTINHLLNNNNVDTLTNQHLASYHQMNQLTSTSSPMGFHPSNVYTSKSHLSTPNGFLPSNIGMNNGYHNQFNHTTNQINTASTFEPVLPVTWLSYDANYSNYPNFCSS